MDGRGEATRREPGRRDAKEGRTRARAPRSRRPGRGSLALWALAGLTLGGCDGADPAPGPRVTPDDELRERLALSLLGDVPYPADNPFDPERVELGRLLFFDPILSGERDVACATCHLPQFAFTDGRQFAAGVGADGLGPERIPGSSGVSGEPVPETRRNTTTVLNTGLAPGPDGEASPDGPLFWDGRALGLEEQALQPLVVREEMRGDAFPGPEEAALDSVVARLRALPGYVERFSAAFAGEAASALDPEAVTVSTMARAIAAYQRELVTRNAPVDRWIAGENGALSETQKAGMELFFGRARCFVCHTDPLFASFGHFVTGVPPAGRGGSVIPGDDVGREEHTGDPADRHAFRVPSLRNVELTAPYMHSGVFETLEEVVAFYDAGARPRHPDIADADVSSAVRAPLELTGAERGALADFLRALTDPGTLLEPALVTAPETVPSGLSYTGESADFIVMASIASGAEHTCAVSGRGSGVPDGTTYCWGRNDEGQLGIGTAAASDVRTLPVRVQAPASDGGLGGEAEEVGFFYLAAGDGYTCGRSLGRDMYCWGGGAAGGGHLRPSRVGAGVVWERMEGGEGHLCALDADGLLYCWGRNDRGQLGIGSTTPSSEPREVPGGPFSSVSAGGRHTCGITRAGETLCWGDNGSGQLGIGSATPWVADPTPVTGAVAFTDVAAGGDHSCGVDGEGRAWCWGSNATGQLGVPLATPGADAPVAVETEARFRTLDAGRGHTCAAGTDLRPWCWGANDGGQLGSGATVPAVRPLPALVDTDRTFADLSAGAHHTCAIQGARGWCWGAGAAGQVGNGDTTPNLVPGVVIGKP